MAEEQLTHFRSPTHETQDMMDWYRGTA